jgi:hypothetical protein
VQLIKEPALLSSKQVPSRGKPFAIRMYVNLFTQKYNYLLFGCYRYNFLFQSEYSYRFKG